MRTIDPKIEAVAQALCDAEIDGIGAGWKWSHAQPDHKNALREAARVAIEAAEAFAPVLTLDVDGYVDAQGIQYIGKATKQTDGSWRCLANVAGSFCIVEIKLTPSRAP